MGARPAHRARGRTADANQPGAVAGVGKHFCTRVGKRRPAHVHGGPTSPRQQYAEHVVALAESPIMRSPAAYFDVVDKVAGGVAKAMTASDSLETLDGKTEARVLAVYTGTAAAVFFFLVEPLLP